MILAKILLDSITDGGSRLTTWELTYPRFIHSEVMTHRVFSRNAASSRAIPAAKLRQRVMNDPAIPVHWGLNQRGMQAFTEADEALKQKALEWWLRGRDLMVKHHAEGEELGLHKQVVNRTIEPWMHITTLLSGTDFANYFGLRGHPDAEPNFQQLIHNALDEGMEDRYFGHLPTYLAPGEWHLPLLLADDPAEAQQLRDQGKTDLAVSAILKRISVGRCARVSYLTHDGRRDLLEDLRLHDQLMESVPLHSSPAEHVAMAVGDRQRYANFEGWKQWRKFFEHENGPDTSNRCARCGIWGGRHVTICPLKN